MTTASERQEDDGPPTARPDRVLRLRASDHRHLPPRGRVPVGRREQRATLAALVDGARAGSSGTLVVRGPRGSGKTHLLEEAVAEATDCVVLRATGVEVEAALDFGAVQQLCAPLAGRVADLPAPQADALAAALQLAPGPTPDPLLVGVALASLLTAVAVEQPVVGVLDDAEWVDARSAQALAVASRRLAGVGVVLLVATGGAAPVDAFAGLDTMQVRPLTPADAAEMLGHELPGRLDPAVRDRVLAEARGRPRALRQIGRATSVTALAGGFAVDADVVVDAALEACVPDRLPRVPRTVGAALLLAAAEPLGDAATFRAALAAAGLPADVDAAVEATGLVEIGDRVLFSHPLVRHVVYRDASQDERRGAHRVLARAVDGTGRVDHVAWHRAQATPGPDEEVAEALERSRAAAERAGGLAAGAAFLDRAAALSAEPVARTRRALAAARRHARAGAFDEARRLVLDDGQGGGQDGGGDATRAVAHLVTAATAASQRRPDAASALLTAAEHVAPTDEDLVAPTLLAALDAAVSAGRLGTDGGVHHVAVRVRAMPRRPGHDAATLLLDAVASRWSGEDAPDHTALARAVAADVADGSTVHPLATRTAMGLRDEQAWATLAQRAVEHARRTGASAGLPGALDLLACLHVLRGEVGLAASMADDAADVAGRLGLPEPVLARVLLAGVRAGGDDPLGWSGAWTCRAAGRGDGSAVSLLDLGRAQVHLASGQYEEALHDAQQVLERDEPVVADWAAPDVVEAAVRAGRPQDAPAAFARVRAVGDASGAHWARGIEHRCAALLADDDAADQHYRESVRHLERSGMQLDLARTHLLYGEWLRRQARRVDARTPLRRALEVFEATGAAVFASRALLELRASGEQARRRTPDTLVTLTERESQVAELASAGHSNPDIGRQLFISARTVEYHLHKVFSKLGITSRAQLRAALPG